MNQFTISLSSLKKLVHNHLWTTLDLSELLIVTVVIKQKVIKKLYRCHSKLKCIEKSETEKVDILNEKLKSLNLTAVRQNSLILEKSSFNSTINISKETAEKVNEVLSEQKQLIRCTRCLENGVDKFCDG